MITNDLIYEKSPYLLQHAHNPVDWKAWNDETFELAKKLDKPIFLSIGYSTCHWCHVMEKESFEDEEAAKKLNDAFICIKVDREERPDIDSIYMTVCQMLTGSGGWPLTIFMTPERKPFFAGTYFPKESKWGRQGLLEIIERIDDIWKNQREKIFESAESIVAQLNREIHAYSENPPDKKLLFEGYRSLAENFDGDNGGFGTAPKFPVPSNLLFLLRYSNQNNNKPALNIVEETLTKMRNGGIYDQIGFGFHRYSTDERWLVPHFEKMLYDQALITMAYIEAYQVSKNDLYKKTSEEIFKYLLRDMTDKDAGFYSAEDADSEGVEGKFYVWKYDEIKKLLGDDAELFCYRFGVLESGNYFENFEDEPAGNNILHILKDYEDVTNKFKISESELEQKLQNCRDILFNHREKRIRPGLDDKILTDWNGLMIASLAKAASVFDNNEYLKAAERAADFLIKSMITKEGKLLHRYRDGSAGIDGTIDDYAFFINGLIELYQTNFNTEYLKTAINLEKKSKELFFDEQKGGYYMAASDRQDLIARRKEVYDSATPSGNSVMLMNLLKLWKITGEQHYFDTAEKTVRAFISTVEHSPSIFTYFLSALSMLINDSSEIVIVGSSDQVKYISNQLKEYYQPNMVFLGKTDETISELAPFTKDMKIIEDKPTMYYCRNFACERPTNDINEIINKIKG
jgi:uncharacterized protein YyaL (SSP411 family)